MTTTRKTPFAAALGFMRESRQLVRDALRMKTSNPQGSADRLAMAKQLRERARLCLQRGANQ